MLIVMPWCLSFLSVNRTEPRLRGFVSLHNRKHQMATGGPSFEIWKAANPRPWYGISVRYGISVLLPS